MVAESTVNQQNRTTMSKRGRQRAKTSASNDLLGVSRPNKNVDPDRENADRIAAAEAMSALSSLVILPTNASDIIEPETVEVKTEADDGSYESSNALHEAKQTSSSSKRGKPRSRGRGGRREIPVSHVDVLSTQKHDSGTRKNETKSGKRGRGKNRSNFNNNKSPITQQNPVKNDASLIAENLNKLVQINRESQNNLKRTDPSDSRKQQSSNLVHGSVKTSLHQLIQLRQLGIDPVTLAQQLQLQKQKELEKGAQTTEAEAVNSGILKLPLTLINTIGGERGDRKTMSPNSVTSTDSVELTQSTVDSILSTNKYDNAPEASLPLKKRRLQTYQDGAETSVVDLTKESLQNRMKTDVTNTDVDETKSSVGTSHPRGATTVQQRGGTDSGVAPTMGLNVDPQTSLMLLNEVQMALRQDEDGDLPLHIAVVHENIVMVQKFVHLMSISGKSVDKYNKAQQTPLHLAVELNFEEAVKILLLAGANPNLVNRQGESAVHLAVKQDGFQCLILMMTKSRHRTDVNCRDFQGLCPLHVAVMKNYMNTVKVLVRAGADVNMQDGKSGRTSLFYAVEANQLEMVSFLQKSGANIEMTNYAGVTAIMAAQARGYTDIASMLLRGLDSKSYLEHKEKEKVLIPKEKKMPLPRIPSKSHLIVSEANTAKSASGPEIPEFSKVAVVTEAIAEVPEARDPITSQIEIMQHYLLSGHKFHTFLNDGTYTIAFVDESGQVVGKIDNANTIVSLTENMDGRANSGEVPSSHKEGLQILSEQLDIGHTERGSPQPSPALAQEEEASSDMENEARVQVERMSETAVRLAPDTDVTMAPDTSVTVTVTPDNTVTMVPDTAVTMAPDTIVTIQPVEHTNPVISTQQYTTHKATSEQYLGHVTNVQQNVNPITSIQQSASTLSSLLQSHHLLMQSGALNMSIGQHRDRVSEPENTEVNTTKQISQAAGMPEKTDSVGLSASGKEKSLNKKEKSGNKSKVKELKKEDKAASRSRSPTTKSESATKSKDGTSSKPSSQVVFGSITNINASVASSLQAKLLQGMNANKPLNLSTTNRGLSEEVQTKEQQTAS